MPMDDRVTVQELIDHLERIKDKKQPIVYQYYLAEHFDTDIESFAEASAYHFKYDRGIWDEAYSSLEEFLGGSELGYGPSPFD